MCKSLSRTRCRALVLRGRNDKNRCERFPDVMDPRRVHCVAPVGSQWGSNPRTLHGFVCWSRNALVGSSTERSLSDRKTALWDNPVCQLCAGIPLQHGRREYNSRLTVGRSDTRWVTEMRGILCSKDVLLSHSISCESHGTASADLPIDICFWATEVCKFPPVGSIILRLLRTTGFWASRLPSNGSVAHALVPDFRLGASNLLFAATKC